MSAKSKIGHFADADEAEFVTSFESDVRPLQGELSADRRRRIEAMARALPEGVPYQTLINSLIRRYVSG